MAATPLTFSVTLTKVRVHSRSAPAESQALRQWMLTFVGMTDYQDSAR